MVSPFKKKKVNRARICDTDEENENDSCGAGDRVTDLEMSEKGNDDEYSTSDEGSDSSTDGRGSYDSDHSFICSTESSNQIDTDEEERLNNFR